MLRRPLAAADIGEIWDYIAEDSVAQADAWVDRLDGRLRLLATKPLMGRAREELAPGLRSLSFGRYVVFYQPVDDDIDVVRVLHSARDIDAQFAEDIAPGPFGFTEIGARVRFDAPDAHLLRRCWSLRSNLREVEVRMPSSFPGSVQAT